MTVDDNPMYDDQTPVALEVDLFGNEKTALRATPFVVRYRYRCAANSCPGHDQTLIDWESGAFARRNVREQGIDEAKRLHCIRFLEDLCSADRDTHFYVGNQHQHPESFLVLGVLWPKRTTTAQDSFDL